MVTEVIPVVIRIIGKQLTDEKGDPSPNNFSGCINIKPFGNTKFVFNFEWEAEEKPGNGNPPELNILFKNTFSVKVLEVAKSFLLTFEENEEAINTVKPEAQSVFMFAKIIFEMIENIILKNGINDKEDNPFLVIKENKKFTNLFSKREFCMTAGEGLIELWNLASKS